MKRITLVKVAKIGALLLGLSPSMATAQPAPFPSRTVPLVSDTGAFRGAIGPEAETFTASRQVVRIPGALWLRLRFSDHNLGAESYITVTSLTDGEQQRLDAEGLRLWQNQTAMFNGDAVEVELHVAPGEEGVFFRIEEVTAGEAVSGHRNERGMETTDEGPTTEAICGTADDRVASAHRAVGRTDGGCTGWIASNGAFITAGHCTPGAMPSINLTSLHFNVPQSQANGAIVAPPLANQYPVIVGSIVFADNGLGDDWALFNLGVDAANDGVDRLPVHAQGAFVRMSRDENPGTVRITGHGVDGPPDCFGSVFQPGCTPPMPPTPLRNADSQTQQTHTGQRQGQGDIGSGSNVRWQYTVDTQRGNSGSPIVVDGTNLAVGMHTNGGCSAAGGANIGTSFENDDLETALRDFSEVGANVRHLDNGHPIAQALQDGTVFRPFDTLAEAVNSVPAGGLISIVAGSYSGPSVIEKAMTLAAPVGAVSIILEEPSPPSCGADEKCCGMVLDGGCDGECVPEENLCE